MKRLVVLLIPLGLLMVVSGCATIPEPSPQFREAQRAYNEERYDEAISLYEKVIKYDNDTHSLSTAYCRLCSIYYYKKGDEEEAQAMCRKALELEGGCWKVAFDAGLKDEVISSVENSIERKEASSNKYSKNLLRWNYHELSYYSNRMGLYDKGMRAAKRAIALKPDDAIAHNYLGWAYGGKGLYDEAFRAFRKAIEIDPQDATYYNNMGYFLIEKGEYKEAVVYLKKAVELRPDYSMARNNLGWAYGKKKQYDEAFRTFRKAIELKPEEPIYHYNMGYFLIESGKYRKSIKYLDRAVELAPDNRAYLLRLAATYSVSGRYDDALDMVDRVIGDGSVYRFKEGRAWPGVEDIDPWSGEPSLMVTGEKDFSSSLIEPLSLRSLIQRHRGRYDEAKKDAERAYMLDPSSEKAQLAMGAVYLVDGRYDEAIGLLSGVEDNLSARLLEATAHARKGDYQKAIDLYASIPEERLSPKHVPIWANRNALLEALRPYRDTKRQEAEGLKAEGRYREALRALGEAMRVADDTGKKAICSEIAGIMAIEPGLSVIPEEARKHALRGDVLTEEGEFEEAVKEYLKAVEKAPYIAKLHFNTAMLYGELKRYPQAISYMKTYLMLAPEAPNVRAARDQVYRWEFMMEKEE